jgi:hypothetical protein
LIGVKAALMAAHHGAGKKGGAMERNKISITQHSSLGIIWFIGWLFTIGYLKLGFWSGLWALIAWPYYIGSHFSF